MARLCVVGLLLIIGLTKELMAIETAVDGIHNCSERLVAITTAKDDAVLRASNLSTQLEAALEAQAAAEEQVRNLTFQLNSRCEQPTSPASAPTGQQHCSDLAEGSPSGVYELDLGLDSPIPAYCDMDTDDGGWTVIQRRADIQPRESFSRDWQEYKDGFGNLTQETWWGNENVHRLTSRLGQQFELRVDLGDWDGNQRYAKYQGFRLSAESDNYRLSYDSYEGDDSVNSWDSLQDSNNSPFSTRDKDNDDDEGNCAERYDGSGWWWSRYCGWSNLNGVYISGGATSRYKNGVLWRYWKGNYYSLKSAEMKIRPVKKR